MRKGGGISIWFFVGILFVAYGIVILGAGIRGLFDPPKVATQHQHLSL